MSIQFSNTLFTSINKPMVTFSSDNANRKSVAQIKNDLLHVFTSKGYTTLNGDDFTQIEDPESRANIMVKTDQFPNMETRTLEDKGLWLFVRSTQIYKEIEELFDRMSLEPNHHPEVKKVSQASYKIDNIPVSIWLDERIGR